MYFMAFAYAGVAPEKVVFLREITKFNQWKVTLKILKFSRGSMSPNPPSLFVGDRVKASSHGGDLAAIRVADLWNELMLS